MTRAKVLFAIPALVACVALVVVDGAPNTRPVYIGARACAQCHSGEGMGHQYALWRHSKHSQAYAALAKPEAKQIAALSGLRMDPLESPICLGCHVTAGAAEDWEKDEGFHVEDGMQCEGCHGPGSEYATEAVMRDRNAATKAGLRMPTEADCMNCHLQKGSHVAVLKSPQIDIKKAMAEIAHPHPKNSVMGALVPPAGPQSAAPQSAPPGAGPKYVGALACGVCHRGAALGNQFRVWRLSPHARAWAVLATPKGRQIAKDRGVQGDVLKAAACLKCHQTGGGLEAGAFAASFMPDEGVGCEACHGPGSEYMHDAVMRDKRAAVAAGLRRPTREVCASCHGKAFEKPGAYEAALKKIAHPTKLPEVAAEPVYKNPLNLALRPDGKELYVTCEMSGTVIVVDPVRRQKLAEMTAGGNPTGVAFTPDGKRAFVTNRLDDTVSVIDVAIRKSVKTLKTGDEPHGVLTDREGRRLYVLNTASNDISVYDVEKLEWVKNLSAGNGPWSVARSPDGMRMLVTNNLAMFAPLRARYHSEVSAIETERGIVEDRLTVADSNLMMGIDWHPSGKFAFATLNRTKNMVPMTRLMQGWTITNGLAVLWRDGRVDQVLLDEPGMGFADATSVAFTPDGRHALVTSSGTDRVAVVDVGKLTGMLASASDEERERVIPNHLGKPTEFVIKHIPTKHSPRGVLVMPDGRTAFVANSLDDSLTVIDVTKMEAAGRIDLGGPKQVTKLRFGERLFHNANISFRKQFSCHSCHPDGHVDGLAYDIEADGVGVSPVDNRTLRGINDTAPFKWEGTNPSLSRQCGPRLSVFFTRLAPFTPEQLAAVDYYITNVPRPPNRYHPVGSRYTPAQRRGKLLFERTMTNDGRVIPPERRCSFCHNLPYGTNRRTFNVGTRQPDDRTGVFDVPHLNNIYDSAPYLHNGMSATLEEIWTVYNPDDKHGVTNDMTKDQLNELIEYIKTI